MEINSDLLNAVVVIITTLITAAGTFAIKYVENKSKEAKAKTNSIQNEDDRKFVQATLDTIERLIETNIISIESTLKPDVISEILKSGLEGKNEKLKELSIICKNQVLNQLSQSAKDAASTVLGDLDDYISNRLEYILNNLKNDCIIDHTFIPNIEDSEQVPVSEKYTEI